MSRGDGRALEAAAEAMEPWARSSAGPQHDARKLAQQKAIAKTAIDAYLSALLSELPEEAVREAVRAYRKGDLMNETIRAFLLSLRSSSREFE